MGNSPSRNELHGDHMSNLADNSGQETFQSHSYPAKFSSVPGIHNEQFNATLPVRSADRAQQQQQSKAEEASGSNRSGSGSGASTRNGTQSSGGPNTPDLLYSMDSLNVCGNNSSSITSAELPPSSISPARDPWSASSFTDESFDTQCRNLSRLHKDLHHRTTDDEGLSSSTYESDSLNPDATLSGMHHKKEIIHPFELNHQNTILRREVTPPKPEVAQEATEELPLTKSNNASASNLLTQSTTSGDMILSTSSTSNGIDHSITINGRKVSGGEETPLPIIVGLTQAEADQANGNCVSSKIGITSSEINTPPPLPAVPPPIATTTNGNGIYSMGTIKRGSRMKSPPPPPPPLQSKQPNGSNGGGIVFQAVVGDSETTDKKMTSLNTLMCRNVDFGSRSRKCNGVERVTEEGKDAAQLDVASDEVNVIKTPSSSSHHQQEKTTKSTTSSSSDRHGYAQDEAEDMLLSKNPCENGNTTKQSDKNSIKPEVAEQQQTNCSSKVENDDNNDCMKEADKVEANKHPTAFISTNLVEEIKDDDNTKVLIRPCKGSKQSDEGVITSNDNSQFSIAPINSLKEDGVVGSVGEKVNKEEEEEKPVKSINNETVNEQNSLNHISVDINKTELDCKDGKEDSSHNVTPTTNTATNTTACSNALEIKPVSCSSNANEEIQQLSKIDEEKSLIMLSSSSKNDTDKTMIDGNKVYEENLNGDDGFVSVAGLEFPENCDKQLETETAPKTVEVSSTILAASSLDKKVNDGCGGINSKFGTKELNSQKGWGEFSSRENTPLRQAQPSSSSSSSSPTAVASCEGDALLRGGNKSEKSSNSSSRRGSLSASSADLNVVGVVQQQTHQNSASNGILSCNRISLCSLPDNEMDVDNFESPTTHGSETIRDQPIACQTNYEMLNSSSGDEDTNQSPRIEKDKAENVKCEKVEKKGEYFHENSKSHVHGSSHHHHHHHQRKPSISKIDFNSSQNQGKNDGKSTISCSAPVASVITSLFDKNVVSRKGSFPELYVNTSTVRSLRRKLSVGNEIYSSSRENLCGPSFKTTNPFFSDENDTTKGYHVSNDNDKSLSAKNDFLQTLGEIYASKSKLLTNKVQSIPAQPPVLPLIEQINPKETTVTLEDTAAASLVSMEKTKSRDASIETVDGYECQDRSISEYNISPRSARELVTESLINGTSSLSSTVSQKSIVTINDSDVIAVSSTAMSTVAPVPFSTEIDDKRKNPFGADITGPADVTSPLVVIPPLSQSSSLGSNHSATYKKKASFVRGRVSKGDMVPCVEIFEPSSSPMKTANTRDESNPVKENDEQPCNGPVPPPMPCLQFSRNNSYSSTASSSNGDSVDGHSEKCKSPSYGDRKNVGDKLGRRISPEKTFPKVNGNTSSECSLIEVNLANQKSTSDAIILELKKAQARKLKFAEENSADSLMPRKNEPKQCYEKQPRTVAIVEVYEQSDKRLEDLHKKSHDAHLCGSVSTNQQPVIHHNHETLFVEDPPVKAIVNGKHTNNIIVNETPVVITKKESLKKPRSGVYAAKSLISQQRGNIMSPSLSGNYTEMNGIDSETMGASSIHEDELSGQLQQKENHINELHGNVGEVQTSNKLDGASFRRVLSEYEKTLSMFIQQIDQLKQRMDEAETEKQTLIKEKDQALEDLRNVESAFSDVHRKYERAKALLENMKSNEDTLIRRDQEMMQRIQNRDKKIDLIKEKAQESIEKMHLDYETRIKEMEFENAKLRAQYRKMEMKLSTLENDVEQKAKENAQLSALCDELINGQVGQV